ncbi:MAG TPA: UDP-N-acetylmuramoyl-tripeptide--D-alanyl-D-alanine ligase [Bacilli bacterium]|nr:UDP-N-acetylmuramoyl-tripeptide--D-alanyl-D-alanine ligase [Bacilli bacterium]
MDILTFIYVFGCFVVMIPFTYEWFLLFQQEHYSARKILNSLKYRYFKNKAVYAIYIATFWALLVALNLSTYVYLGTVVCFLWAIYLIPKAVVPLKITPRLIRLTVTYTLLVISVALVLLQGGVYLGVSLSLLILPFLMLLANFLNYPVEQAIRIFYLRKAQKKLSKMRHLIKFGITGSFGKTSTKNILTQLLSDSFLVAATPKSFNTPLGIALTINKMLPGYSEVFIAEMGAFRLKEIKYLADFVKPQIAVITDIGPQHLSTFKTVDNIVKAKTEILENTFPPLFGIVNADSAYLRDYLKEKTALKTELLWVGIENKEADIYASDIQISGKETSFDLYIGGKKEGVINTKLLGRHNVYNILFGVAGIIALQNLGYDLVITDICEKIKNLKPIEHRLEYQKWGNWDVYNDSYNANIQGFINGLEVLKKCDLKKAVITPGIVDAGKEMAALNTLVARELLTDINWVLLIDNQASRIIEGYFLENNFTEYLKFASFSQALGYLKENYSDEQICLLIENDLPDHFLIRK